MIFSREIIRIQECCVLYFVLQMAILWVNCLFIQVPNFNRIDRWHATKSTLVCTPWLIVNKHPTSVSYHKHIHRSSCYKWTSWFRFCLVCVFLHVFPNFPSDDQSVFSSAYFTPPTRTRQDCTMCLAPYRPNLPLLISDIPTLLISALSARVPECRKSKMVG